MVTGNPKFMALLIGILINLLILALIVAIVLWVIDLVASAFGFPPRIVAIIKAIIVLIALLSLIQILLGGWPGFYPYHR